MDCKLRAKNCGGCPLLGLDYAEQLKQKEATVKKLLGKYGPVNAIRGMENPYHYRNKVISTFTTGWGGKLTSGIYAANSHKVLPVERCLLQDEVLDKTMEAVRAAAIACRYQPYDEDKGTGLVRHCLLRRGVATGQVMVVLVTAQPVLPGAKNFVRALLAEAEKRGVTVTTVVQNVNPRKTSVVLGDAEKVLYGKGYILDELCGKTYALSPRSFYQINHSQTEVLYGLAVEAAHLTGKEVVLDAYCGIGTIGLTAADHAKQIVGAGRHRQRKAQRREECPLLCRRRYPLDQRSRRCRGACGCDLHGSAAGGLHPAVHRERGPHGPEAGGLRQLQPGDTCPRPRPADEEGLPRGEQHPGGYVPAQRAYRGGLCAEQTAQSIRREKYRFLYEETTR